ncbi:MAG: lysylphosphatidylglycerol synthase transmembrane domain-containing protein [Pseudohongiella sp.]|nr:lysylphosphatidylglycerol synthase transmembrane domain-containing protein [Pseudohongiella sp.]
MPQYRWTGTVLWIVALALVVWTLSQMPLAEIGITLRGLAWVDWSAWLAVNILVIVVGNVRWLTLTRMVGGSVGFIRLLLIRQAGQTVSFITPGPQFGGEPLQIYWLYKHTGMAIHRAVLALGLDRFFELWINFLMLILGVSLLMLWVPSINGLESDTSNWQRILWIISAALVLLSALAVLAFKQPALISRQLEKLSARWLSSPRLTSLDDHWQSLGSDLRTAIRTQKPALFAALMYSFAGWALIVFEMWLVVGFFEVQLQTRELILILVAMRLALLLPLPGGIGTLEASVFWSFQALGLPASAALGLIAIMRFRDALVLIAGLLCARLLR